MGQKCPVTSLQQHYSIKWCGVTRNSLQWCARRMKGEECVLPAAA
jgi:hypothetical protein